MGLKTPVKKALGEQNNYARNNKDINCPNSEEAIIVERPSDLVPTIKNNTQNRQYLNIDDSIDVRESNPNVAIDENDEARTERIEMLRKSIGRGNNRSGLMFNNGAHNNSFKMDVMNQNDIMSESSANFGG